MLLRIDKDDFYSQLQLYVSKPFADSTRRVSNSGSWNRCWQRMCVCDP